MITGAGILVFGLPMVYFMRNSPEEMGLLPDGDTASTGESGDLSGPKEEVDFTIWEALKTRSYWTYVIALLLRASILSSMVIHQIPHLVDIGIDYQVATGILGSMILISIVGRGFFGWIGDIFDKRWLLFIICFLQGDALFIRCGFRYGLWRRYSAGPRSEGRPFRQEDICHSGRYHHVYNHGCIDKRSGTPWPSL